MSGIPRLVVARMIMESMQVHLLHALCFVFLAFFSSFFALFVVYLPALPLLVFSNKLFDSWNEMMIGTWFHMIAVSDSNVA